MAMIFALIFAATSVCGIVAAPINEDSVILKYDNKVVDVINGTRFVMAGKAIAAVEAALASKPALKKYSLVYGTLQDVRVTDRGCGTPPIITSKVDLKERGHGSVIINMRGLATGAEIKDKANAMAAAEAWLKKNMAAGSAYSVSGVVEIAKEDAKDTGENFMAILNA